MLGVKSLDCSQSFKPIEFLPLGIGHLLHAMALRVALPEALEVLGVGLACWFRGRSFTCLRRRRFFLYCVFFVCTWVTGGGTCGVRGLGILGAREKVVVIAGGPTILTCSALDLDEWGQVVAGKHLLLVLTCEAGEVFHDGLLGDTDGLGDGVMGREAWPPVPCPACEVAVHGDPDGADDMAVVIHHLVVDHEEVVTAGVS